MTLNEFIDKLISIKESNNAGNFNVKVPHYFDMELQGNFTPWQDDADITDDEICVNAESKTVCILNKDEIKNSYWSNGH
jgi:hypothetical protein